MLWKSRQVAWITFRVLPNPAIKQNPQTIIRPFCFVFKLFPPISELIYLASCIKFNPQFIPCLVLIALRERNLIEGTGWKNAEVPFFISFSHWTCHFTSIWKGYSCVTLGQNAVQKFFTFSKPARGYLRKQCFICWSKSHLSQSTGP